MEETSISCSSLHCYSEGCSCSACLLYTHPGMSVNEHNCWTLSLSHCLKFLAIIENVYEFNLCIQRYVLGRPIMLTRSVMFATAFMCFFATVIALFKVMFFYLHLNKNHISLFLKFLAYCWNLVAGYTRCGWR